MAQACQARLRALRLGPGAVLEVPPLVGGLDDVEVVGEPVEERGGHLGVAEVGPGRATLEWVDWFDHRRLLYPTGAVLSAEAELYYYAALEKREVTA